MIAQVRRGLYLVPERLPLGGRWSPDEGLALNTLFDAINGRYQICGPNAFNRYDFDEQVPTRVYVYNNREWGDRRIVETRAARPGLCRIRFGTRVQNSGGNGQISWLTGG